MKTPYLILFFLFLISCASRENSSVNINSDIIQVDLDESKSISLYELFSRIEIIPMETSVECIMGDPIREMVVDNGEFYFLARGQNGVWHFNAEGKFVREINYFGSGPHEYTNITDFRVNRFTNDLEILCARKGLFVYDHSGAHFKRCINFMNSSIRAVHNYIELSPSKYLLFCAAREGNKMVWYDAKQNKLIAEGYDFPMFLFSNTPYHHSYTPFYVFNDSVHFVQAYDGAVLTVDTIGGLTPKYRFDFGKYNFDVSQLEEKNIEYYVQHAHQGAGTKFANRFIAYGENSKYYLSRFTFRKKLWHLLLNKGSGKAITFNRFKEDCFCFPVCMDETAVYMFANPQELDIAVNPEFLPEHMRMIYDAVAPDNNPVVVKYVFK